MRLLRRVGALVGGVALVALGAVFVVVGLDNADKIASVVGAFVGLLGLGVSGYGAVLARRSATAAHGGASAGDHGHSVSGTVHGDNVQIGQAGGDVTIRRGG